VEKAKHLPLRGRGAVVTGGGRGIGRAVAAALAARGCAVVVAARTQREIKNAARDIVRAGGEAFPFRADVRSERDVARLAAFARKALPAADILVNAAGDWVMKDAVKTTPAEWRRVLDTNLTGAFLLTRAFLPAMKRRRRGFMVHLVSVAGKRGFARCSAYCASKFGLRGFLESVREEARPHVRVMGVYPGAVDTAFWDKAGKGFDRKKMMPPEDVAEMVAEAIARPRRGVVEDFSIMPPGGVL
jgi:NAD(P)-dependent dehydrogenase (short-subunit alcohol dehydrogenase family)